MQSKGTVLWTDLTVENAEHIKDFYGSVVGWTFSEQAVADCIDYNLHKALELGDKCMPGISVRKATMPIFPHNASIS